MEHDDFDSTDDEIEKFLAFLGSATSTIEQRGKTFEWKCPICGGKAVGGKARSNGHIHAKCNDCNMEVMQ